MKKLIYTIYNSDVKVLFKGELRDLILDEQGRAFFDQFNKVAMKLQEYNLPHGACTSERLVVVAGTAEQYAEKDLIVTIALHEFGHLVNNAIGFTTEVELIADTWAIDNGGSAEELLGFLNKLKTFGIDQGVPSFMVQQIDDRINNLKRR